MKYWKTERNKFLKENPYCGPYATLEQAESWAAKIRAAHRDAFRVIAVDGGFEVEQDGE